MQMRRTTQVISDMAENDTKFKTHAGLTDAEVQTFFERGQNITGTGTEVRIEALAAAIVKYRSVTDAITWLDLKGGYSEPTSEFLRNLDDSTLQGIYSRFEGINTIADIYMIVNKPPSQELLIKHIQNVGGFWLPYNVKNMLAKIEDAEKLVEALILNNNGTTEDYMGNKIEFLEYYVSITKNKYSVKSAVEFSNSIIKYDYIRLSDEGNSAIVLTDWIAKVFKIIGEDLPDSVVESILAKVAAMPPPKEEEKEATEENKEAATEETKEKAPQRPRKSKAEEKVEAIQQEVLKILERLEKQEAEG